MLWLFLMESMILDGTSAGAGMMSVSAAVNGSAMVVTGQYEAGGLIPVLLWPRTGPWVNPCRSASDLCCMADVGQQYTNDALRAALARLAPRQCMVSLAGDLVKGSRPGVESAPGEFKATVPVDTPFVAMLFVNIKPFFIIDGVQQFLARPDGLMEVKALVTNSPCYHVVPHGLPFTVCMHCVNPLPSYAHFVWTPSWYVDLKCDHECDNGYAPAAAGGCEALSEGLPSFVPYAVAGGVVLVLSVGLCCLWRCRGPRQPQPPSAAREDEDDYDTTEVMRAEVIAFKEGYVPTHQWRIKIS
jgi:hypothetical protein